MAFSVRFSWKTGGSKLFAAGNSQNECHKLKEHENNFTRSPVSNEAEEMHFKQIVFHEYYWPNGRPCGHNFLRINEQLHQSLSFIASSTCTNIDQEPPVMIEKP